MSGGLLRVTTMVESIGYAGGGAERVAVTIARNLDRSRFESHLCVTRWDDSIEGRDDVQVALADLEADGVVIHTVPRSSRFDLASWRSVAPLLRSTDVIHSHMVGSNVWATVLGRLFRVPVIVAHEHMWSFDGSPVRRILDRDIIGRGSDLFLTVSGQSRQSMIDVEGVPGQMIEVLRNGIPDRDPGDGDKVRRELGISPDQWVVGSVGLLREEKAFEVLVASAQALRRAGLDFRIVIVGDGPEREKLDRLRAELGVEDDVIITGVRLDVPDLLAAMNVGVCCSDWEGGPLSVLEYMQAELPVVATRVGGLPEMVRDGETGILVEPRDPEGLAAAVVSLAQDESEAARLARGGNDFQRSEHRLATMVEKLEDRYEGLYAASRRR